MKYILSVVIFLIICSACGPKPYYKTAEGRKKQKYYNKIQFGGDHGDAPPPKTKKRN